jgi:hypothetical protein
MAILTSTQKSKIYAVNQEIIDITGSSDKEAFNELMTASDPLAAIKYAYKMICKIRGLKVNDYFIAL